MNNGAYISFMFNTRFGKLKKLYLQNTSRGVDGVHKNEGRLLTEQPLSHLDYNRSIIECVHESKERNESRKYCHFFG
ncbi:hypothetical protein DDB_G0280361 [Dictyostelium discoideum AX4]|uniref:Uncharacterized protein n=1 Tax=Dictyostelium discoideum TaxID=44689 RepID=Q54VF6_DICDI|nr:hypothetical protein DDB_G0280361 [Dictyostelium discoideum AX4]EAL67407.1 hypothetical protein DDB_G0280361 [Dictyostelium discoideum AX4]|eukprot:XP_641399.1 hypothetical protein DDB_G0280361 [Dictyostelium discoideum AX4]